MKIGAALPEHLKVHTQPKRGEIWQVDFEPTVGSEIKKERPALVISADGLARLPLRVVVPITEWQESFEGSHLHIRINSDTKNKLRKDSAADIFQIRTVSITRMKEYLGELNQDTVDEVASAILILVDAAA